MKIIIDEHAFNQAAHFNQRYEQRLSNLPISDMERNKVNRNMSRLMKMNFSNGSYAVRILKISPSRNRHTLVNFKGKKTVKHTDGSGKTFYGNEVWVIMKNNHPVTLLLRASHLTKDDEKAKKLFKVRNIVRL